MSGTLKLLQDRLGLYRKAGWGETIGTLAIIAYLVPLVLIICLLDTVSRQRRRVK